MCFLSYRRKYILCWVFLMTVSMLESLLRYWEIVDPRNLKDSIRHSDVDVEYGEMRQWWGCYRYILSMFSSRLLWPHHRTSCLTSCLTPLCLGWGKRLWYHLQISGVESLGLLRCSCWCRGRRAVEQSVRKFVIHWQVQAGTVSWVSLVRMTSGLMVFNAKLKSMNRMHGLQTEVV